jgi:hypothetical protein
MKNPAAETAGHKIYQCEEKKMNVKRFYSNVPIFFLLFFLSYLVFYTGIDHFLKERFGFGANIRELIALFAPFVVMPLLYWGWQYARSEYGGFDRDELIYFLEKEFDLSEKLTQMIEQGKESEAGQKRDKIETKQNLATIEHYKNDLIMSLNAYKEAKEQNRP